MAEEGRGHSEDERECKCIILSDQGILWIHTGGCRVGRGRVACTLLCTLLYTLLLYTDILHHTALLTHVLHGFDERHLRAYYCLNIFLARAVATLRPNTPHI